MPNNTSDREARPRDSARFDQPWLTRTGRSDWPWSSPGPSRSKAIPTGGDRWLGAGYRGPGWAGAGASWRRLQSSRQRPTGLGPAARGRRRGAGRANWRARSAGRGQPCALQRCRQPTTPVQGSAPEHPPAPSPPRIQVIALQAAKTSHPPAPCTRPYCSAARPPTARTPPPSRSKRRPARPARRRRRAPSAPRSRL